MLKYNRNPLIVVMAKLYNLLERKMINKIVEFFKKPSIRLILPIIGIVFIIVSSILFLWHGNANRNQSIMNTKGAMKLTGVNDSIMDVFDITGFLDILTIE